MPSSSVFLAKVPAPTQGSDLNASHLFPLACYTIGKEGLDSIFIRCRYLERESWAVASRKMVTYLSLCQCELSAISSIYLLSLFASFMFFQKVSLKDFSINSLAI